jgi:hypothetical protein
MATRRPSSTAAPALRVRGYILFLTHYDPWWVKRKPRERPFNLDLALELVDEIAAVGFNTLVINVSDGVIYRTHPEFAKRYSVPMTQLRQLSAHARTRGLEIIPKLNFSRSAINCHNHWIRAPGEEWHTHFDDEYYWNTAFETIDELIEVCKPARFFHVGMDEDHDRSYSQYVAALVTLQTGLTKRGLRTVAWSDSALDYVSGDIYREKSLVAEERIPRTGVRVVWNYWAVPAAVFRQVHDQGHELWGAPGHASEEHVLEFKQALLKAGGTGMLMAQWLVPCRTSNRQTLLANIRRFGPLYV